MVNSATEGVLGWTSRGQLEAEMRADAQRRAPVVSAIAATAITDLPGQPESMQAAVQGGAAAFRVHCVQCPGAGGAGWIGRGSARARGGHDIEGRWVAGACQKKRY